MTRSRRIIKLPLLTLSALFASVVLFGGSAHAQGPVPLSEGQKMVEQHAIEMQKKSQALQSTAQEVDALGKKKLELAQTLEAEKKLVEELRAKVAEKKRIEAIRAEEQAKLDAYVAPNIDAVNRYVPPTNRYAGNSAGNTYYAGQCTWHVKNLKPELPNVLGNADMWFANATAQGWPTGYQARAGAAAQTKGRMHVSYVIEVYGDGNMLISEMNFAGPYSQRTAVVPQANYIYIY